MLDPEYIRRMTEGSEQIASLLHEEIIKRIVARLMARLAKGENYLTSTDRWNLQVLSDAGYLMEDIQAEIAAGTQQLLEEVVRAFEDAAVQALNWDDAVYKAAGLEPAPLRQSPYLMRLAQRNYEKTAGELRNFTGTLAEASQQTFIRQCDRAYQLVAAGAMGYPQAVRQAVEAVAAGGVVVTYPSGHRDTIETATLRAVRTGVGQACGDITLARMREMDWPIVLVSAHLGARTGDGGEDWTNHFWWQGKFYRRDDESGSGTETLTSGGERGTVQSSELPEPDIQIGRSLGAKAKNYEILDLQTGDWYEFVEGTALQDVHIFAGKGTKTPYRKAVDFAARYGGEASDWQHVKGIGHVAASDGDRMAEVHWSQCEGIGRKEFFIKKWLD